LAGRKAGQTPAKIYVIAAAKLARFNANVKAKV
jgi:hypothetical protein